MTAYDSTRPPLGEWEDEVARFFEILGQLDKSIRERILFVDTNEEQLLQGPLADAMLHLGQIGIFVVWLVHLYIPKTTFMQR